MKRWIVFVIFCTTTLFFGIGTPLKEISKAPVPDVQTIGKTTSVAPDFGKIPLYFIANNGQVDKQARFYARTSRYTLWITPQGMIFDSIKKDKGRDVSRLTFLNSRQNPTIVPEKPSDYRVNFLKGNDRSGWHTQVPTSERVCYQNLYNNIDLKVYGVEKQIEYDWVIKPGGNPMDIRFDYQNIKKSFIDETGNLVIQTAFGEWLHKKPVGYQVINGKREAVEIAFIKRGKSPHVYGFKVACYDKNYDLIIDPMVIAFTSYLGGNDYDYINGMVVDGNGSMIVAGYTDSSNFPVLNGWDETRSGSSDGFVTKFSPNGTSLVFSTFVGGSNSDSANSIALDSGGIYIGGSTGSSDFPTLNAFQGTFQGEYDGDGFVCKLSSDGSGLIYSSFLGGSASDCVDEIAVNTSGELYALGSTFSMDFPLLNPIQSTRSGYDDLFVTKVSASGSSLVYSTLLGGNGDDQPGGIAIDNTGCAYVTGSTNSIDFPTINAFQPAFAGGFEDGFVSKISSDGSSLVYSTYLGGPEFDMLCDIKVDNTGAAYVTGFSGSSNYPTTPGSYQPTLLGSEAAVITKFSPSGSSLVFSTFLGGSNGADGNAIALDNGSVYIAGRTISYDFPLVDPFRDYISYYIGNFIARFSPDGSTLEFSSFLSGAEDCDVVDMAVDGSGNLYLTGSTTDFFPAYQGFQNTYGGGSWDGFVTKLVPSQYSRITITSPNGGEYWTIGSTREITWTAPDIMENVKIILQYYQDYDLYEITIAESAPNTGIYEWTVPNISSDRCFIDIQDPSFHIQYDMSDANFTISGPPSITLGIPNGGEELTPGSQYPIVWGNGGIIGNVSIDYSIDSGNSWISIAENVPYNDYFWTVPDTPSTNCLVRVTDPVLSVTDTSDAVFTILSTGSIIVTSPNGGESWEGGTTQNVTWTSTGAIANVKLEYSDNNGSSWNTITDSTFNSGTYNWTIPNTPSTSCLVRVSDTVGPATDTSDAVFTILPLRAITLTSPNGGENWIPFSTYAITWTSTGNVTNVSIDYSTDSGNSWTPIVTSIANTGSYSWTVPNTPSANCLVKVSEAGGVVTDTSDALFSIDPPRVPDAERDALIALYNSTNGDNWTNKSNWRKPGYPTEFNDPGTENTWYGITVNANNTHAEQIQLNSNNLTGTIPDLSALENLTLLDLGYNNLTGAIPTWLNQLTQLKSLKLNTNHFSGTIPDLSNLILLETLILWGNDLTGTIPASINNLTSLISLSLGSNQLTGNIPDITALTSLEELYLFGNSLSGEIPAWLNNMSSLRKIVLKMNQFSGEIPYLGGLPNLITLDLSVNQLTGTLPAWIEDMTVLEELSLSVNQLTGTIPELTFTHLWSLSLAGNQFTGNIPSFAGCPNLLGLDLANNQLVGEIPVGLANLSKLRLLSLYNNHLTGNIPMEIGNMPDLSSLRIQGNLLKGNLPSTIINLHDPYFSIDISWSALYTDDPQIKDIIDDHHLSIYYNQNYVNWTVVQTVAPTDITVGDVTENSVLISWTPIAFQGETGGYRVYYSTTPGTGYTLAGTTSDKTMSSFTVTDLAPGTMYYFVVETFTNPHEFNNNTVVSEYSEEVSTTTQEARTITVTSPNGGESWEGNTSHSITWTYTGNIANVMIEYSLNNGSSWNTIAASTANTGSYNWTVPNTPFTTCLVKVSDAAGPAVDQSNAVFTILTERTVTVTAPNGGESWEGNTSHAITWTSTGDISNVKLEYSTNSGSSWNTITASTANSGSYNWTVPNSPSTTCLVKVSDAAGPASDQSNAVFTILTERTLTVTAPNGGESIEGNTSYAITWTYTGDISTVKIEYSINSGSSWNTITASTANSGSYNWTVPNSPSTTCLVKVTDAAGPASDQSNTVFTIAAERTLTVTAPNGGESWEGNTVYSITWDSTGAISSVMIEYSSNSGSSWNTIAASTANTGSYNWTVPNSPSSTCLIKISDITGPASDQSNALFNIVTQRTITVTSPNGAENLLANTTYPITWTSTGAISSVVIEYSSNSGSSWNTVTASTANSGSYNWTIPAAASTSCLVKVSDTAGPAYDQSNTVFTISNVTYCSSSGTSQSRGYIARVQVGDLDNSSGSSTYTDFTSLIANLTAGSSTNITLTPSTTNNTEYWKIWIDYNRDGDFADSGENVYSGSGKTTKTGSFTVPTATTKGTGRMRVTMRYNSTPTYCDAFSYGEVEDYTVNIQ